MRRANYGFKEALVEIVEQYLQPLHKEMSMQPANAEESKKSRHFGREQVMQLMHLL